MYEPLPNAREQIRLLRRTTHPSGDRLVFELTIAEAGILSISPLEKRQPFNAISYTWGDPAKLNEIVVNGQTRIVRQNAYYALWQHSMHHADDYVWMDSVCINQDDLKEKSQQVEMMGEIYHAANLVVCCVGPDERGSEVLAGFSHDLMAAKEAAQTAARKARNFSRHNKEELFNWLSTCSGSYRKIIAPGKVRFCAATISLIGSPSGYSSNSNFKTVLESLGVDHSTEEIKQVVQHRRFTSNDPSDAIQLLHDSLGQLTSNLILQFTRVENDLLEIRKSAADSVKPVMVGSDLAAILCSNARAGDFLLPVDDGANDSQILIIARKLNDDFFGIIGEGFTLCGYRVSADLNLGIDLVLSPLDAIAMISQDMLCKNGRSYGYNDVARLQRLSTKVSDRYTLAAVQSPQYEGGIQSVDMSSF